VFMPRVGTYRMLGTLALLVLAPGAAAMAQQGQFRQEWALQHLRAKWCVYYLMDSTSADKQMPHEFRPLRAGTFPGLSPAVRNLIQSDSTYSSWVPAQFCSLHLDSVRVGDQSMVAGSAALNDAQFLGAWLIGASPITGGTEATRQSFYLATFCASNWHLIRLAEISLIKLQQAKAAAGKIPESAEDRYQVSIGHTVITWDGHLAGDSAWAAPSLDQDWWSITTRGSRLRAQVTLAPDSAQSVAGAFQVVGKDDLAKSLRASPIRMVGPLTWGGSGSIVFSR
jgi:hypothetical protein